MCDDATRKGIASPPEHVAWARHQFVAFCVVSAAPRCAAKSFLAGIPNNVLVDEIGRRWIMGVSRRAVVGSLYRNGTGQARGGYWFVSVSHTLGVVRISSELGVKPFGDVIMGWLDRNMVVSVKPTGKERCPAITRWPSGSLKACLRERYSWGSIITKFVRSRSWAVVYTPGRKAMEMWPIPLSYYPLVLVPLGSQEEELMWMDIIDGERGVVSVKKGELYFLRFIDLEKTYKLRVFSITREFQLDTICCDVYFSTKHGIILSLQYPPPHKSRQPSWAEREFQMVILHPNQVVSRSYFMASKVDSWHFVPAEACPSRGETHVYSTNDLDHVSQVFVHDPDSVTRVSDGLIAIQCQKHIDLLDALTGRWLWRQAAPLDTQDILYMNNLRLSSF